MAKVATKIDQENAKRLLSRIIDAYNKLPDEPSRTQSESFWSLVCRDLPTIREANSDNGKKVRRMLRATGYRISDRGYFAGKANANANAKPTKKRERKAKVAKVNTTDTTDVNANATEVAKV